MSLINQALRKAQQDRAPKRMGGAGVDAHPSSARPGGPQPALFIGVGVALAALIGLVAGLSILLLRNETKAPHEQPLAATTPTNPPGPSASSSPAPLSSTSTLEPPLPGPLTTAPVSRPLTTDIEKRYESNENLNPTVEEFSRARAAAEAKLAAEAERAAAAEKVAAEKAAEAAARAAAQPSQAIIDWLTQAQVSGVRLSDTESKVILNGKAYATGEYVNDALGIKLMIIQEKRLLFEDANGKKYMKRL